MRQPFKSRHRSGRVDPRAIVLLLFLYLIGRACGPDDERNSTPLDVLPGGGSAPAPRPYAPTPGGASGATRPPPGGDDHASPSVSVATRREKAELPPWSAPDDDEVMLMERKLMEAKTAVEDAKSDRLIAVRRSDQHRALRVQLSRLERKLDDTRRKGTAKEQLAATRDLDRVRGRLEQLESRELEKDDVFVKARQNLAEIRRAVSERRHELSR